ncbi:MAG: DUF655 domain-containing protein [Nostocales cyanobacterium 94392]|nr:DUF655 domain-containing protein [Nostocales cyanobacterium 94392]
MLGCAFGTPTVNVPQPNLLTGVGKKLAERIVRAREEKRFDSWEDLERVSF